MKEVTCCNDCPFYDDGQAATGTSFGPHMCGNPQDPFFLKKGYGKTIYNSDVIPSWCNLRYFDYVKRETAVTHVKLKAPNKGGS